MTFSYQHAGGNDDGEAGPPDGGPSRTLPRRSDPDKKINILIHIDVFYARLLKFIPVLVTSIRDTEVINLDQKPRTREIYIVREWTLCITLINFHSPRF